MKIKVIQGIFKQNIKPKCQIKWEEQYGGNIDWTQIWTKLKKIKVTNKVKEFQWKCLHNINYTEHRLKKMNLSNGRCHLCQIRDNDETMQHLFFKCPSVNISVNLIFEHSKNVQSVMLSYKFYLHNHPIYNYLGDPDPDDSEY